MNYYRIHFRRTVIGRKKSMKNRQHRTREGEGQGGGSYNHHGILEFNQNMLQLVAQHKGYPRSSETIL
jgi:hypothetical protein